MRTRSLRSRLSRVVRRPLGAVLAASPLLALVACGGGSTDAPPAAPQLARLTISAPLDTLTELVSRTIQVAGVDTKGQPIALTGLTWQSSDTTVLSVSAGGDVTAKRIGSGVITVQSGSVSTTLAVRVVPAQIWTIGVSLVGGLGSDTLLLGSSATLVGEPHDIGGRTLLGRTVTFAVTDTTRGTVAGSRLTGRGVGLLDVVARVDTVERHGTVIVRPPYAGRIAVKLADPKHLADTLWVGLRDSAVVSFADAAGQALSPAFRSVTYSIDDPKVASLDGSGRVLPLAPGNATLTVSGDKLSATVPLHVYAAPITSVISAPDTVRVLPGELSQIRPILVDGAGLRVSASGLGTRTLRFDALDPGIATVDAQGNVRGVAIGNARVRIASDRGTGVLPVRVTAPITGDDAFHITVRFIGPTPAPDVVDAFNAAKARWENVIRRTTGFLVDTLHRGECSNPDSTAEVRIADVLIFARIDSIDGPSNILGSAGPCAIKEMPNGHWIPVIGRMTFDSADMRTMSTTGRLGNVIAHEMAHVLGIGTMWASNYHLGVSMARQSGSDPRYFGPGGVVASAGMGFTGTSLGLSGSPVVDNVPLENTGGSGTAGSHWRRSIFGNELMNGFAGTGPQPLSLLTLLAMSDLGYVVNTSYAESWGQFLIGGPTTSLAPYFLPGPAMQLNETLLAPELARPRGGRLRRTTAPR